jgi:hypothetical protein
MDDGYEQGQFLAKGAISLATEQHSAEPWVEDWPIARLLQPSYSSALHTMKIKGN